MNEIGITIRFSIEKLRLLDAHVAKLKALAGGGVQVTRTDAVRNLIERGLADAVVDAAPARRAKRKSVAA